MKTAAARIFASTALTLAALSAAGLAQAAPQPVDDEALSNSYAGDGTDKSQLPNVGFMNFATLLATLSGGQSLSPQARTLVSSEFLATMAQAGVTSLPSSVYNGQTVTEVTLPSHPVSATMQLSQFISSMTGVKYNAPGMGTISINNMDAGGTRLWVWNH